MDNTQLRSDHFFELSCNVHSLDYKNMQSCINQGIDSRLEGFTKSEFSKSLAMGRLYCWIHVEELQILIRRLLELENEDAELLAADIIYMQYGIEVL